MRQKKVTFVTSKVTFLTFTKHEKDDKIEIQKTT